MLFFTIYSLLPSAGRRKEYMNIITNILSPRDSQPMGKLKVIGDFFFFFLETPTINNQSLSHHRKGFLLFLVVQRLLGTIHSIGSSSPCLLHSHMNAHQSLHLSRITAWVAIAMSLLILRNGIWMTENRLDSYSDIQLQAQALQLAKAAQTSGK